MPKTITISFCLDPIDDRDLLRWLEGQPERGRSEAIRETLRAGLMRGGVTLGDLWREVQEIKQQLRQGAVVVAGEPGKDGDGRADWSDEPPEAAAALDLLATL